MVAAWNLIVFLVLTAAQSPTASSWEKLYETPSPNRWIFSVWLAEDGSWRAASNNLILTGDARSVRPIDLGPYDVYAFGEDSSGVIIAVGSRQAIWEEDVHGFTRVHALSGPAGTGRAAHHDVLDNIGYFDPEHPDRLFALASVAFGLWRGPDRVWRLAENNLAARRGIEGPDITPPQGCHVASWTWLDSSGGFLGCHDGEGYLYRGTSMLASMGPMPRPCRKTMSALVRMGKELFAACGERGEVWHFGSTGDWTVVSGVTDVRSLHARNGCLLAGTRRAVYRRCAAH
jgi:hypothetical protein